MCPRLLPLAAAAALWPAAISGAAEPAEPVPDAPLRFAPGTPAMATALQLGYERWGGVPCGGDLRLAWRELPPATNATSSWSNPFDAYERPDRNHTCSITFNTRAAFDWPKFCTITVHELGHLAGHPHAADPADIMAVFYAGPDARCAATRDPSGFVPRGRAAIARATVGRVGARNTRRSRR